VAEGASRRAAPRVRRVRSERRASLEAQRRSLAAACTREGRQLLEALEDARLSATDLERPGIEEARRVLEHADPQALVAHKRERPAQALLELVALLASARKQGFALVALACTLETQAPPGEALASVLATFAPLERGLHSQRIRRALAAKRAQGVRLGRPPSMSPYALERIRCERAGGKSLAAIANGLNADRIPTAQGGAAGIRRPSATRSPEPVDALARSLSAPSAAQPALAERVLRTRPRSASRGYKRLDVVEELRTRPPSAPIIAELRRQARWSLPIALVALGVALLTFGVGVAILVVELR